MPQPDLLDSALNDIQDYEEGSKKKFEPARPRLKTLSAALGLYHSVLSDDSEAAKKRAKVDGMFDGRPPYDHNKLKAAGQGGRCNINFGEAQRLLDAAQAGYVDLITSTEYLTDIHTTHTGGDILQDEADAIINEELTGTLRDWPEFAPRFLSLSTEFLKHGIGATYFDDQHDWRFQVAGLKDLKFPRFTRANEEALDICFIRKDYAVHELFEFISDEGIATSEGWVVDMVKKTILNAHRGEKEDKSYNWEAFQQMVKNSDTYAALQTKNVRLVHTWVKETDGKVSHYIWEERLSKHKREQDTKGIKAAAPGKEDYLYKAEFVHDRSEQAFTIFTYGVGNNGTYHSIRGYGQRIFPHIQYLNRLQCQMADSAAMAGGLLVQPNSMEDLRNLAVQFYGPFNVLRPNLNVVDRKASPDLTKSMIPVVDGLRRQLEDTSDFYSTSRAAQGSPYRNQLQVRAELEASTRLSAANLALFYASKDRLIREVVRRIVDGPKSDPAIREFFRRCTERGLTETQIKSIDHRKTKAARAIGAGNPAARIAVLDQLNQERPWMDEVGNRTLTFDRVAARIGHDQAKRYVRRNEAPRGTTEQSLAVLENSMMQQGMSVPVLPAQFHGTHLEIHAPIAQQFIDEVVGGQIDPVQNLPILQSLGAHVLQHAQAISADPNQQDQVALALDISNKLRQIIENSERSVAAEGGGEGAPEEDPKVAEARALSEAKRQIMVEEAALKRSIKEDAARQDQRLKDFAAAAEAQRVANREAVAALSTPFSG